MAKKKKKGMQTIFICENCGCEIYRVSPKDKNLVTIDANIEEKDLINKGFNFSKGYYQCVCGSKHRLIRLPKKEGDPLFIELGTII